MSSAALVTYSVTEADIAKTKAEYAGLSADTPKGYEEVRIAIGRVRETRVAIEKRRVELKADALEFGRRVDTEAKRYTTLLLEIEDPLKAKKAAVDDEKERQKREAEAEKLRAIEAEIAANRAKQEAEARAVREAEEKRLAEERAKLAAERAEFEAKQKAEDDRIEAAREAEYKRQSAEREKLAEERRQEEAKQRAEREAIEAERKRVTAEREKAERAEFERQAKMRAEKEAAEKIERDRVEAARQAAELAAMLPDVEKLVAFVVSVRTLKAPKVKHSIIARAMNEAMVGLESIAMNLDAVGKRCRK